MSEKTLLPCPCCGSEDLKMGSTGTSLGIDNYIRCTTCGLKMQICEEYGQKELIKRWNTRKPLERIVERLEEFAECKSCEEAGLSESFYYGQGCKACMWKKIIDIVKGGGVNDASTGK